MEETKKEEKELKPFFRKWQKITIAIFSIGMALIIPIRSAVMNQLFNFGAFILSFGLVLIQSVIEITVGMALVSIVLRIIDKKKKN